MGNNPLIFTDPTGMLPLKFKIASKFATVTTAVNINEGESKLPTDLDNEYTTNYEYMSGLDKIVGFGTAVTGLLGDVIGGLYAIAKEGADPLDYDPEIAKYTERKAMMEELEEKITELKESLKDENITDLDEKIKTEEVDNLERILNKNKEYDEEELKKLKKAAEYEGYDFKDTRESLAERRKRSDKDKDPKNQPEENENEDPDDAR